MDTLLLKTIPLLWKVKPERENTMVRLAVPFAVTEVFDLKMQVELFL